MSDDIDGPFGDLEPYPAVPAYEDEHDSPRWFGPVLLLSVVAICGFLAGARWLLIGG